MSDRTLPSSHWVAAEHGGALLSGVVAALRRLRPPARAVAPLSEHLLRDAYGADAARQPEDHRRDDFGRPVL